SASIVAAWCTAPPAPDRSGSLSGPSPAPASAPSAPDGPSPELDVGSSAGERAVLGRALPSGSSSVFASGRVLGGGASSSSLPLIGRANAVARGRSGAAPEPLVSAASHGFEPPGACAAAVEAPATSPEGSGASESAESSDGPEADGVAAGA